MVTLSGVSHVTLVLILLSININTLILVSIKRYKYHGYNISIKNKILGSESSIGIRDTISVSWIQYTSFICMILAETDKEGAS